MYFTMIAGIVLMEFFLKKWVFQYDFRRKEKMKNPRESQSAKRLGEAEGVEREEGTEKQNPGKTGKWIQVQLLENDGVAGGRFAGKKVPILFMNGLLFLWYGILLWREKKKQPCSLYGMGIAMVLGGGLGNITDRIRKGSVTDYIRFPFFPIKKIRQLVFNLSDFAIFLGVAFMVLGRVFGKRQSLQE